MLTVTSEHMQTRRWLPRICSALLSIAAMALAPTQAAAASPEYVFANDIFTDAQYCSFGIARFELNAQTVQINGSYGSGYYQPNPCAPGPYYYLTVTCLVVQGNYAYAAGPAVNQAGQTPYAQIRLFDNDTTTGAPAGPDAYGVRISNKAASGHKRCGVPKHLPIQLVNDQQYGVVEISNQPPGG
jgi:hypothetical protein